MKAPLGESAVNAAAPGKFEVDGAVAHHEAIVGQKLFSLTAVVGADADKCIGVGLGYALVKGGDEARIPAFPSVRRLPS